MVVISWSTGGKGKGEGFGGQSPCLELQGSCPNDALERWGSCLGETDGYWAHV